MLLDQAALAFSLVKGKKVPEPADLSDHTTISKCQPALGDAAELHITLLCHTALRCTSCTAPSTLAASREKKPPELRKFYMLPVTTISLNKHCLWPTLFTHRETTLLVTPHFPHRAIWRSEEKAHRALSLLKTAKWNKTNKEKAYWFCTNKIESKC